ncbi:MAG: hypothetical protein RI968_657 [Pseudomonadota bacterium]
MLRRSWPVRSIPWFPLEAQTKCWFSRFIFRPARRRNLPTSGCNAICVDSPKSLSRPVPVPCRRSISRPPARRRWIDAIEPLSDSTSGWSCLRRRPPPAGPRCSMPNRRPRPPRLWWKSPAGTRPRPLPRASPWSPRRWHSTRPYERRASSPLRRTSVNTFFRSTITRRPVTSLRQ